MLSTGNVIHNIEYITRISKSSKTLKMRNKPVKKLLTKIQCWKFFNIFYLSWKQGLWILDAQWFNLDPAYSMIESRTVGSLRHNILKRIQYKRGEMSNIILIIYSMQELKIEKTCVDLVPTHYNLESTHISNVLSSQSPYWFLRSISYKSAIIEHSLNNHWTTLQTFNYK